MSDLKKPHPGHRNTIPGRAALKRRAAERAEERARQLWAEADALDAEYAASLEVAS